MRIKSIRVENFRSARGATIELDGLTALAGANGAGKSTFLRALLVFQGRQEPDEEDFYNRDTAKSIEIAVTFTGLSGEARKKFARYLRDGELVAVRVCWYNRSTGTAESPLRGTCKCNPAFDAARKAPNSVDALDEYDRLCGKPEYAWDLVNMSNGALCDATGACVACDAPAGKAGAHALLFRQDALAGFLESNGYELFWHTAASKHTVMDIDGAGRGMPSRLTVNSVYRMQSAGGPELVRSDTNEE